MVTFLCSIVFLGEPQHWSCMTSQVALALGFALCLSSIMGGSPEEVELLFSLNIGDAAKSILSLFASGKTAVLMLRAQALKAARLKAKAAAKAAKAAAENVANGGGPDVIATSTINTDASAFTTPEKDTLTFAHQRMMAAVATLIQVKKKKQRK